jgi:hypothetical protein
MTPMPRSRITALVALVAVVAACGAGCISPEQPPEQPVPGPEFHQVTEGYDDRVVFSVIPKSDTPGTYVVDYEILRNGTTEEARDGMVYENVAEAAPIVFEVPRSPGDSISLEITVRTTDGDVLHTSTTVINPEMTVPAGEGMALVPAIDSASL